MNTVKDLVLVIKSHFPLVCVETNEETRLLRVIENACNLENWSGFTWTIADGVRRINGTGGILSRRLLGSVLMWMAERKSRVFMVPLTRAEMEAEASRTKPLSVVMAERMQRLRDWARDRTVPAN